MRLLPSCTRANCQHLQNGRAEALPHLHPHCLLHSFRGRSGATDMLQVAAEQEGCIREWAACQAGWVACQAGCLAAWVCFWPPLLSVHDSQPPVKDVEDEVQSNDLGRLLSACNQNSQMAITGLVYSFMLLLYLLFES